MALAVDDTSAYKIFLLDYELVSPNTFNCKLKVDIYDHFGLDKSDVSKKSFIMELVSVHGMFYNI